MRWTRISACILTTLAFGGALSGCGTDHTSSAQAGRLSGTVLDSNGSPAFGAVVAAQYRPQPDGPGSVEVRDVFSDGQFDFGLLTAGDWILTTDFGLDQASADTVTVLHGQTTTHSVRLAPAAVLRGTVLLSAAISHADVGLRTTFPNSPAYSRADGSFEMGGLAPGQWPVWVSRSGYRDSTFTIVVSAAAETVSMGAAFVLFPAPPRDSLPR